VPDPNRVGVVHVQPPHRVHDDPAEGPPARERPGRESLYRATRAKAREPIPLPAYSRWHRGVTTFGPLGKILLTSVVGFFLWLGVASFPPYAPLYALGASVILYDVWRKEQIEETPTVDLHDIGRFHRESKARRGK